MTTSIQLNLPYKARCNNCLKEFTHTKSSTGTYCSIPCYRASVTVKKKCKCGCGKNVPRSRQMYVDPACTLRHQKRETPCPQCSARPMVEWDSKHRNIRYKCYKCNIRYGGKVAAGNGLHKMVKDYKAITKHIDDRSGRHESFKELFSNMRQYMPRSLEGKVLTLPGDAAHIDTTRIQHHFYGASEYVWYENKEDVYNRLKTFRDNYNKSLAGSLAFSLSPKDILRSRHQNVAFANVDLQCVLRPRVMNACYRIITEGIKKRHNIGLVLNTSGRGPKGMTMEKRDIMWKSMLTQLKEDGLKVLYDSGKIGYTTVGKHSMFLYGTVINV